MLPWLLFLYYSSHYAISAVLMSVGVIKGSTLIKRIFHFKPVTRSYFCFSQMVIFLHCQDRVCQECVNNFVTITIKDKNILHLVCPVCGRPDNLEDEAVANEYFNHFDILVISCLHTICVTSVFSGF